MGRLLLVVLLLVSGALVGHTVAIYQSARTPVLDVIVLLATAAFLTAITRRLVVIIARSKQLEDKVAEDSVELEAVQKQVQHMEKMASLGKLAATVAHELNNPISGMLTYARLVEREVSELYLPDATHAELQRYLQLIQRECTRCGAIVQNMLVFARKGPTQLQAADLNEIVGRSLMLISHHMEMRGVLPITELLRDSHIVADPGELEQALVALMVNAVEAMPDGGQLTVRLLPLGDDILLEVSDTGVGIAPEVQPMIFEPFYSTKKESGSGLGLAVVYGIVHKHRGSIRVLSQLGRGTTFQIQIPRDPSSRDRLETALGAGV